MAVADNSDLINFAEETPNKGDINQEEWKLLIVDDEEDVHKVTRLVLHGFEFQGKKLSLNYTYSALEAGKFMKENPDTAVALVDVVMENEDSGLRLVRYIRDDLHNNSVRIILRTGQPGQAPEQEVVLNYDINDYKAKTELTSEKLFTTVISAIRSYRDINTIEKSKIGLEKIIQAASNIFEIHSLKNFLNGILMQFVSILQFGNDALYGKTSGITAETKDGEIFVVAATGAYEKDSIDKNISEVLSPEVLGMIKKAKDTSEHVYDGKRYVSYFSTKTGYDNILFLERTKPLDKWEKYMVDILCTNAAIAFENVCINEKLESLVEQRTSELQNVNEELSVKNRNIKHELEMARKVQMTLFPSVFPDSGKVHFTGKYLPMQDLGGDFFDVFKIDEERTAFAIVDVSGHGPSASLVTSMIKMFFSAKMVSSGTTSDTINEIHHNMLSTVGASGIFATMFLGIINHNNLSLEYSNAGHTPAVIISKNKSVKLLRSNATVVGVFQNAVYVSDTLQLEPGDRIILYTDGLIEARNPNDKMLGENDFHSMLSEYRNVPLDQMCDKIFNEISSYSAGIEQDDDRTMLAADLSYD